MKAPSLIYDFLPPHPLLTRALPDIMSCPKVHQIFKIPTDWKPDIFVPGRWTFNTFKNRNKKSNKNIKKRKILKIFFLFTFLYIPISIFWHQICVQGPYHMRMLRILVRIQSGLAGPLLQIWMSGPVRSGNSYGWALLLTLDKRNYQNWKSRYDSQGPELHFILIELKLKTFKIQS